MKQIASMIGLRAEREEEYLALSTTGWPQVQQRLPDSNNTNYSIFLRDRLFAYYQYVGGNYAADMAAIAADEAIQRRRRLTDPCHQPLPTAQPGQRRMVAVEGFRLEEGL
jgi:L-rhamnose mutarotase